ncbi:MAG: CHAT domain-containing protein [Gammaproteobacteria bacterium]|nr:CHAT domain-containing protein [Gammaproteobacteria bacterium]
MTGNAGKLSIIAKESVLINGPGGIAANVFTRGQGGKIEISAPRISVENGAVIQAATQGAGNAGQIILETDILTVRGEIVTMTAEDQGEGGDINVQADSLVMEDGGWMSSDTLGDGNAGSLIVKADTLTLTGAGTKISASTEGQGNGGDLTVSARQIRVQDGAGIEASTAGAGDAGRIAIRDTGLLIVDGQGSKLSTSASGSGRGNNITVDVGRLGLKNGGTVTAGSTGTGDAGKIDISVKDALHLQNGSYIQASTAGANGGGIRINTSKHHLRLTGDSGISTSVKTADGDSGNIELETEFLVMDKSKVIAQAYEGDGGKIDIVTTGVFKFPPKFGSEIDASSRFGANGIVSISAPNIDADSGLIPLSTRLPKIDARLHPCNARLSENLSGFTVAAHKGVPNAEDDWLAAGVPAIPPLAEGDFQAEGERYFLQGDFRRAAAYWREWLTQTEENADIARRIDVLSRLAVAYQHLALYPRVFEPLEEALSLAQQIQDTERQAMLFTLLSDVWLAAGDIEEALELALESVELARLTAEENPRLLAAALNSKGNVLAVDQYSPEVIDIYDEAARAAFDANDPVLRVKILLNELYAIASSDDFTGIGALTDKAWTLLLELPDSHAKASGFISAGLFLQKRLQDIPSLRGGGPKNFRLRARAAYGEAARIAERLGDKRAASIAYGRQGRLYQAQGDYTEALALTRKAVFFAEGEPDILYLQFWQQGRIFDALGDIDQALAMHRLAVKTLKPIQWTLAVGYRQQSARIFEQIAKPVYYGLTDLLLQKAAAEEDKQIRQQTLREARDTMESIKVAELQDYFQDECVTALQAKAAELDRLMPRTAVLYPIPLPDRLVLLLSSEGEIQQTAVPVRAEQFYEVVLELRRRLQTRPDNMFREPAKQLYTWLIRPIEAQLTGMDTLVAVPDGSLRTIPLAALYDGERFLIEKYALAVTPGLTLTDPRPIKWDSSEILLAGLSEGVQDYSPLPGVPKELKNIQNLTGGERMLNAGFSIAGLSDRLKSAEYSVIHLATHGEFDSDPEHTYLLTYQEKMTMDDLKKIIGLGRFRDKPIELLTLSACKTAVGDDRAALGLAGVAVKAGARSAVASLWYVDDEAASLTVTEFYRQLLQNRKLSKAKALQNAQKKMLAQKRYAHPAYWAPFLLIGNWL